MKLLDIRMHDGSRHFLSLPESCPAGLLRDHLEFLPEAAVAAYLTDHVCEGWIDFIYRESQFSVSNQNGEFWFFVDDPHCPDEILHEVLNHCARLTGR
jgi:hypothetical protein